MLRAVGDFRPGDFIHVGENFGRVSERGVLHAEIQSESGDLVTVPNLHVVSSPVKVVRASGTIISADASLGYDVDHVRVQQLLLRVVESAGLSDPFVRILGLEDHAVRYRASGFLEEVRQLLTARSRLHAAVLDVLHGDGVEIVSPSFMNQRVLEPSRRFVADPVRRGAEEPEAAALAEEVAFDKAESAALREQLRDRRERLLELRERLRAGLGRAEDDASRESLERRMAGAERQIERLDLALEEPQEAD